MLESFLGLPTFFTLMSIVVFTIVRGIKEIAPSFPKEYLPIVSAVFAYGVAFADAKLGGLDWAPAAMHALAGILAGLGASGGHSLLKGAMLALGLPEDLVIVLLGRMKEKVK